MKPTIPEVKQQFFDYFKKNGYSWGQALHVAMDDGNVENGHIEFCIKEAAELNDLQALELAKILLTMSKTQRLRITHIVFNMSYG